jgi:hypothetical protein
VPRADTSESDPGIDSFMHFLFADSERFSELPLALVLRIFELTEGVVVDLDEEIVGPVAL